MKIYENNTQQIKQVGLLLKNALKSINVKDQIPLLIRCMDSTGYIKEKEQFSLSKEELIAQELQDLKDQFTSSPRSDSESEDDNRYEPEFVSSFTEQDQSSISGPFVSRTYIQGNEKLSNINVRGIASEEQDYNLVREKISNFLNKILSKNPDLNFEGILKYAMEFYLDIKKIYIETNLLKGEMKGAVKKGYILLVLYYALINFRNCVNLSDLVSYFEISLSDLTKADKNIKMVFGDNPKYLFINNIPEMCLNFMRNQFDKKVINLIETKIKLLQESGKINTPATSIEIAAIIHIITKLSLKKIGDYCGISPDTIRKITLKL